jgi:hypothetical protein
MFKKDDLVVDERRQLVGRVMELAHRINSGPVLVLRPPRGGLEWETPADKCRPAEPHELVDAETLARTGGA